MKKIININKTIQQAILKMNKTGSKSLVVVDDKLNFMGTLSGGDIRKKIIKDKNLKSPIKGVYNNKSKFFYKKNFDLKKIKKILIKKNYDLIPVINDDNKVFKIYEFNDIFKKKLITKKIKSFAVIMAGGKGTRMEPFTKILPKPLVPIKDTPVIDLILNNFYKYGIYKFYFSVNYKKHILKAYLKDKNHSSKYLFIDEKKPLGTAGSLSYFSKYSNTDFIVSNCDIIVKANYEKIFNYHKDNKNDITIVVCKKKYVLPYGNCKIEKNSKFIDINEKPVFDFLINTGFYVINSDILKIIPKNKLYNFTDLINDAKKINKKVFVYKVSERKWIDVGQWPEYKKAIDFI